MAGSSELLAFFPIRRSRFWNNGRLISSFAIKESHSDGRHAKLPELISAFQPDKNNNCLDFQDSCCMSKTHLSDLLRK